MFFKYYQDGRRKSVDLDDLYEGQHCFLLGGAPSLKHHNLSLLNTPGVITIGINNVTETFKTTMWIGADRPDCYSPRMLYDISILKFACMGKRSDPIDGVPWQYFPATLFWSTNNAFNEHNLLTPSRDFCWWKNTWFNALQLAYRLGFRTVYTLGADFVITPGEQYAWETKLDAEYLRMNGRLYAQTIEMMRMLKPHFEETSFNIMTCSNTSRLIEDFEHIPLAQAVNKSVGMIPRVVDTTALPHSKDHRKQ